MKQIAIALIVLCCLLGLATPALADQGTLQWGTDPWSNPVATITDDNNGGQLVPVGALVELWHENGVTPLATAHIGDGYITPRAGRVVANTGLAPGHYSLVLRVFNVPDPYAPDVVSCSVIVGANGRGTPGIPVDISVLMPVEIFYPSAAIPTGTFSYQQGGGCEVMNPLAVTLNSFTATAQEDAVLAAWETASEIDLQGFNLYRGLAADGPWTQLNDLLIPGQAPGSTMGYSYDYLDREVTPGATYYYLLESIDLAGHPEEHGPVSVYFDGAPTAVGLVALTAQPGAAGGGSLMAALLALASLAAAAWKAQGKK